MRHLQRGDGVEGPGEEKCKPELRVGGHVGSLWDAEKGTKGFVVLRKHMSKLLVPVSAPEIAHRGGATDGIEHGRPVLCVCISTIDTIRYHETHSRLTEAQQDSQEGKLGVLHAHHKVGRSTKNQALYKAPSPVLVAHGHVLAVHGSHSSIWRCPEEPGAYLEQKVGDQHVFHKFGGLREEKACFCLFGHWGDIFYLVIPPDAPRVQHEHKGPLQLHPAKRGITRGRSCRLVYGPVVRFWRVGEVELRKRGEIKRPSDVEGLGRCHVVCKMGVCEGIAGKTDDEDVEDGATVTKGRACEGDNLYNVESEVGHDGRLWLLEGDVGGGDVCRHCREVVGWWAS
jgi:hypothetical protein